MKQIIIISFLVFSVLSSCTSQTNRNAFTLNDTGNCDTSKLVRTYYFDKDSIASLEVLRNEVDNYIFLRTKWHRKILSIAGEGNIDFVDEKLNLDTVFFEKDKEVFILPTYVFGSTYGAVVYFLIYEGDFENTWEIFKIPFDRFEIKTGKDGLSNIVRYTTDKQKSIYVFKNGILQQVK